MNYIWPICFIRNAARSFYRTFLAILFLGDFWSIIEKTFLVDGFRCVWYGVQDGGDLKLCAVGRLELSLW